MHIIVFSLKRHNLRETKLSEKVFLYPTNSLSRWLYIFDAYNIAKRILTTHYSLLTTNFFISTQDPFEAGLAGYFLKKKFGLPLQLQIHTDFLNPYFIRESFLNRVRVLLAKFLLPRADCVRVVSERIRRSLLTTHYSLPTIAILPAFVDFQKIAEQPIQTDLRKKYPNRFIILMASRLTREKNIASAIEAMAEVIKQFPRALLLIVGDGQEQKNLKSQISNLKIEEHIILEPWTNNLASYYKTADLFLVSSFYEGYGRTILEALACGLPVVSTKVGIAEEAIQDGENGFLIFSPDSRAIANALQKVIVVRGSLRSMRIKTRGVITRFIQSPEEYLTKLKESFPSCE
jgi:glycosyltransferase involved in cell wall biosynthesis